MKKTRLRVFFRLNYHSTWRKGDGTAPMRMMLRSALSLSIQGVFVGSLTRALARWWDASESN